jgi:glycosyltransferase involved in cell wall biosynthesis
MDFKVSVIICCYTLERLGDLHEAIRSVQAQSHKPHEIIVAVDHNEELFNRLTSELPPEFKVVISRQTPGLSTTRNVGISHSTGDIISFIDDDAIADRNWLTNLCERFHDPRVIVVGGKAIPKWLDGNRPWWFPEELNWIIGCSYKGIPAEETKIRNVIGCNMAFRRTAFERAGLFSSEVGRVGKLQGLGEEAEICLRIKNTMPEALVVYEQNAVIYHKVPKWRVNLKYVAQRSFNEGLYKHVVGRLASSISREPLSTENSYLRYLLLNAIPQRLIKLHRPAAVAAASVIMLSISSAGLGYIVGMRKNVTKTNLRT